MNAKSGPLLLHLPHSLSAITLRHSKFKFKFHIITTSKHFFYVFQFESDHFLFLKMAGFLIHTLLSTRSRLVFEHRLQSITVILAFSLSLGKMVLVVWSVTFSNPNFERSLSFKPRSNIKIRVSTSDILAVTLEGA
jgi:hypothetical protein